MVLGWNSFVILLVNFVYAMFLQVAFIADDTLYASSGADTVFWFPIIAGLIAVYLFAVKKDEWALYAGFLFPVLLPIYAAFSGAAKIGWLSAILGALLLNSYALAFIHSPLLDKKRVWILIAFVIGAGALACLRIAEINI